MNGKRKKNSRHRGSKTHSWGAMKKHRGAGNKGGRGNAGTGKRSDCKKPSVWGIEHFYGKHGFTPVSLSSVRACNIETLERAWKQFQREGVLKDEKGVLVLNLSDLGIDKLLSKGTPTKKWHITAKAASASAIEKIKEHGGEILCTVQNKEVVTKK